MKRNTFFLFAGPSLLVMITFLILPVAATVWMSLYFMNFKNLFNPDFIGLANYTDVLGDPAFWSSMGFTAKYIVITVPARIALGFGIALLLDQMTRFRGFFIAAILLPFIVTPVVNTTMFKHLFFQTGIVTYLLRAIFDYRLLLLPNTVEALIYIDGIWSTVPFSILVLFAGLQVVSREPIEAAIVDGATWLQQIWHIVLPYLRPQFAFIGLISIMDGFRVFDSVLILTSQNSAYVSSVLTYNFRVAVSYEQLGKASAINNIVVVLIMVLMVPLLLWTYRQQLEAA